MTARQKRIALINDITGFGRCSVAVQLPLISAMRVQACPLPTAILSVHTGFPNHYLDDYTERMRPYMENWAANALDFDAILTGFLGSEQQIEVVLECIARFKRRTTAVIVDTVMGDNGRLYSSYTPALCAKMRQLLPHADVVTPNLTEACQLLDLPYPADGEVTENELLPAVWSRRLYSRRWQQRSRRGVRARSSSRGSMRGRGYAPISMRMERGAPLTM